MALDASACGLSMTNWECCLEWRRDINMARKPQVCVLRAAGTNCDQETAFAFEQAGADSDLVHVNALVSGARELDEFQILAFPGGFSYGDDLGAGKILANELKGKLLGPLKRFIADGKLIIGICNGFQVLVKSGLLPGNPELRQEASLIINDSGKFEDRWVYLKTQDACLTGRQARRKTQVKCVWVKDLPEVVYLPVAHGEGKFVVQDALVLKRLKENGQIVFRYCDEHGQAGSYPINPNGAIEHIAGICDETGRILGLMPHPERHIQPNQHPRWTGKKCRWAPDGSLIFKNGVAYARELL